jgi:hypothetical protein
VPALFFTALTLAVLARCIADGFTTRRAAWLGVFGGFALATKEPVLASLLAIPIVLLLLYWRANRETSLTWWGFWRTPLAGLLAAFMAFGIGSGLFVDPERYFAHLAFISERGSVVAAGDAAFLSNVPYTTEGHLQLAELMTGRLIDAMTLPGLLLALFGLLWVLRREPIGAAFMLPGLTYLLVLFWSARTVQLRYVMPAVFVMTLFAARAVTLGIQSRRTAIRIGFAILTIVAVGLNLLRGVDLTYAMINDSRYAAAAWLESRTQPGSRIEYFGPDQKLPPLEAGVKSARAIEYLGALARTRVDEKAAEEIRQGWRVRRPDFVIIMPDFTSASGVPHSASCPPEIYQGLLDGSLGYQQAAYFETLSLLPWVQRPKLDYPSVNPPIRIFVPAAQALEVDISGMERVQASRPSSQVQELLQGKPVNYVAQFV